MFRSIGEQIDKIMRILVHLIFGMVLGLICLSILLFATGKLENILGLVFRDRLN